MKNEEASKVLVRYAELIKQVEYANKIVDFCNKYKESPVIGFDELNTRYRSQKPGVFKAICRLAIDAVGNCAVDELQKIEEEKTSIETMISGVCRCDEKVVEKEKKIVRIRSRWAAFNSVTGESRVFETMADMCEAYGWSPGGDVSRAAKYGKKFKGIYMISKIQK